jgi:truncated hemoglobin YjbI
MPEEENQPDGSRGHRSTATAQLGGSDLETVVDRFYAAVLADSELAPSFRGASMDRLVHMQRELFAAALGDGPMLAASQLQQAHAHLHLQPHQVSRFFEHLVDTMEDLHVDHDTIERLVSRLGVYVDDVVGSHGEGG